MTVATFELPRCIAVNPGMMPDGEDDRKPPIKPACEPLQHWSSSSASSRPSSVASDEPPSASSLEEPTPFSIPRAGPAPPDAYLCPISCQLMTDPVTLESGHTFDRGSIRQWFAAGRTTCPLTRRAVDPASLQPNTTLKTAIQDWVRAQDDAFASVPLADRPLEVVSGHFLIPRQQPQSGSAEDVLSVPAAHVVQLLERAGTSDEREALIQVLLTQAAVCNRNKHAIIATGVIPTLVWLVFSAETCTLRWYAAELVSFLTTIASALPIVHDALMRVVPWVGWRTAQHGQRGMLHCLLRAVCSRQETQASAAVWVLWLLCAKQGDTRRRIVKASGIKALQPLMSHTSSDTLRVAAARVLRCLALVDRHVPMLEASGAVAGLAVLLRTGTPVVKLAACCALSNVANSPRAGPLNLRLLCDPETLAALREMLLSDSLQARRTAAVLVKVLCSAPPTATRLLEDNVLRCCVKLLHEHPHEFYLGVLTALLESAAQQLDREGLRALAGCGAVDGLAMALSHRRASTIRLDALRALQALLCASTVTCFVRSPCFVAACWHLLGSTVGIRQRHQCAALMLEVCTTFAGRLDGATKSRTTSSDGAAGNVGARLGCQDFVAPLQLTPRTLGIAPLLDEDAACSGSEEDDEGCPLLLEDAAQVRWLMKLLSANDTSSQCVAAALIKHLAMRVGNRSIVVKAGAVHALKEVLSEADKRKRWFIANEAAAALEFLGEKK